VPPGRELVEQRRPHRLISRRLVWRALVREDSIVTAEGELTKKAGAMPLMEGNHPNEV
jgi:hypothetical protein